jgi:hypothetical protein
MPTMNSGASALAPLLDGSSAGELIPELLRRVKPEQMGLAVGGQDLTVVGGGKVVTNGGSTCLK